MLILGYPAKLPAQNDVFEATDHKYQSVKLNGFHMSQGILQTKKHIKITEKIL